MSDDVRRQDGEAPDLSPATLAVRAGEDAARAHRGTQVPIVYSAAFGYEDVDSWVDAALGRTEGHIYSRNTNPTVAAFEEKVRILEGRGGGHELLHGHGRRQQHALRAGRAG